MRQLFRKILQVNLRRFGRLSAGEANRILHANEFSCTFESDESQVLSGYDSNELASNQPNEDRRIEMKCPLLNSYLFGVCDGHGGDACSHAVSLRLPYYIAAAMLPYTDLQQFYHRALANQANRSVFGDLLDTKNKRFRRLLRLDEPGHAVGLQAIYESNFLQYLEMLLKMETVPFKLTAFPTTTNKTIENCDKQPEAVTGNSINTAGERIDEIKESLTSAVEYFDREICTEPFRTQNNETILKTAISGSVCLLAYMTGRDLFVANVGDCAGAIGSFSHESGQWSVRRMSEAHTMFSIDEIDRIRGEHPPNEVRSVLRNDRLLGQLMPLRALGDCCFKWQRNEIEELIVPKYGRHYIPNDYHTPPYLIARPDIVHYRIQPNDRFLILASDGLWDFATVTHVIRLIGAYIEAKSKPDFLDTKLDRNAATHLIRKMLDKNRIVAEDDISCRLSSSSRNSNSFAGDEDAETIEEKNLIEMLSLPKDVVRFFRDDIAVTIVFFA